MVAQGIRLDRFAFGGTVTPTLRSFLRPRRDGDPLHKMTAWSRGYLEAALDSATQIVIRDSPALGVHSFDERAQWCRVKLMHLDETDRFVERALARFIIGEQHFLSHVDVALQNPTHQSSAEPRALSVRADEDVL